MKSTPKLKVIKGGLMSTIQDLGRVYAMSQGFPKCGAMDVQSAKNANKIVGNTEASPVLEMTMIGGTFEVVEELYFAFCGADIKAQRGTEILQKNHLYYAQKGDVISFGAMKKGVRTYLAIRGKLDVPLVLGSTSTYLYAKIGGNQGRILQKNDILSFHKAHIIEYSDKKITETPLLSSIKIKVQAGPELEMLSEKDKTLFFSTSFSIAKDSNRMGIRLIPKQKMEIDLPEIVSSGILKGTIQLPSKGNPIILMADAPVTGGYPRIVICQKRDLDVIAQLPIGAQITFYL